MKRRVIFIYLPLLLTVSHRRKRYEYVPIFSELEKHWVKRQLNNYNRRLSKLELKSKGWLIALRINFTNPLVIKMYFKEFLSFWFGVAKHCSAMIDSCLSLDVTEISKKRRLRALQQQENNPSCKDSQIVCQGTCSMTV